MGARSRLTASGSRDVEQGYPDDSAALSRVPKNGEPWLSPASKLESLLINPSMPFENRSRHSLLAGITNA